MSERKYQKVHVYKCPCGYAYDPRKGCGEANVPAGTPFNHLQDQLTCPRCQRAKVHFREKRFSIRA